MSVRTHVLLFRTCFVASSGRFCFYLWCVVSDLRCNLLGYSDGITFSCLFPIVRSCERSLVSLVTFFPSVFVVVCLPFTHVVHMKRKNKRSLCSIAISECVENEPHGVLGSVIEKSRWHNRLLICVIRSSTFVYSCCCDGPVYGSFLVTGY